MAELSGTCTKILFFSKVDRTSGDQNPKDLFPTGRNQEPRVTLLQDGRFALDKDTQTTFLSPKGELNLKVDNITLLVKQELESLNSHSKLMKIKRN